jgi:hypothetical protein
VSIPGTNLLKKASKLIKFTTIQYYTAGARTLNAARQWVPGFAAATPLRASVQAVNRSSYAEMGLNFNSFYVQVYASLNIIDLQRDSSGDRFIYSNDLYQMENGQSWFEQDGWATCLAVRIKQGATGPN